MHELGSCLFALLGGLVFLVGASNLAQDTNSTLWTVVFVVGLMMMALGWIAGVFGGGIPKDPQAKDPPAK